MTEERRTAVVLFAQAVGLADLPEADRAAASDELFPRLRAVVERLGGTVDKFAGDVLMAVFGAPVAHEDDPARAVRAALALLAEVASMNALRGRALSLRVGINSGEVLWGSVGGGAPTAMGDVVNVAQRLEAAAEPGTVIASLAVAKAAMGKARFRELGELQVKGRREPVAAFLVEGERAGQTEYRRAPAVATPIVGREREIDRILETFGRGRGGYVVLEGEAGIGKSRLMHELRRRIRVARPGTWIGVGRAREGPPLPLGAFGEIVRGEIGEAADGERAAAALAREMADAGAVESENRAALIALSLGYAFPGARVTGIEPARILQETRYAWECWIRARAARGPVLLCVEDLHWADGGTVSLLEHFAARLPGTPVYVVASARPDARLPSGHERVALGELGPEALSRLAEGILPGPLAPELIDFLVHQSGGNPYYLEELARFLVEQKLLAGSPSRLAAKPDRVPAGLQGLLVARLDSVGAETRDALKAASVVGRTFWSELLSGLLAKPSAPFIAEAHARQMVFPRDDSMLPGDAEHIFKHALLRDAAYSLLPKKERARLHLRVAELLPSGGGRKLAMLAAGHREAAGQRAEAAQLWIQAGAEAMEACAWDEAETDAKHAERLGGGAAAALLAARAAHNSARFDDTLAAAERAASASGEGEWEIGLQARLLVARIHQIRGNPARCLEIAIAVFAASTRPRARAAALARSASALEDLGRFEESVAACREGSDLVASEAPPAHALIASLDEIASRALARLGRTSEAREASDRALAAAGAAGDRRALAQAVSHRAFIEFNVGAWDASLDCHRRALDIRREIGDRLGLAGSHSGLAGISYRRGDWEEALRNYEESRRIYVDVGDPGSAAGAVSNAANIHFQRGHYAAALAGYEESLRFRRDAGQRGLMGVSLVNKGAVHGSLGQHAEAQAAFEEALALAREMNDQQGTALVLTNLAILHQMLARFHDALAAASEALALRRALGDRPGSAECLATIGMAHQSLGDLDAAGPAHAEALEIRRGAGDTLGVAQSLTNLAAWKHLRGDLPGARADLDEAAVLCHSLGQRRVLAQILRELSLVESDSGRHDAAIASANESLALSRAIQDRASVIDALLSTARALAAGARGGEAPELLVEAGDLAHALGLAAKEEECRAMRAEIERGRGESLRPGHSRT